MDTDNFRRLVTELAARLGSLSALGQVIGVSPSRLSRVARGVDKHDASMEVVNCLRLAKLAHAPASDVLRGAGKADVADLIEELYPDRVSATDTISEEQRRLWGDWEQLAQVDRDWYLQAIRRTAELAAQARGLAAEVQTLVARKQIAAAGTDERTRALPVTARATRRRRAR